MTDGVDVNAPVENPELVARLVLTVKTLQMVRDANYLMATQVFHPDGEPPIVDGTMRAGTQINLYTIRLPDDRDALAVFTDWSALYAAVGEDQSWRGLIQAGDDVLQMGLRPDYPGGAVINPSGPQASLEMDPERITWMYANTDKFSRRGGLRVDRFLHRGARDRRAVWKRDLLVLDQLESIPLVQLNSRHGGHQGQRMETLGASRGFARVED